MSNAQQSEELIRVSLQTRAKIGGILYPKGTEIDVTPAELARGGALYRTVADLQAEADAAKIVQTLAEGAGRASHFNAREMVQARSQLEATARRVSAEREQEAAEHRARLMRAIEERDAAALAHIRPLSPPKMAPPQTTDSPRPIVRFTPRPDQ